MCNSALQIDIIIPSQTHYLSLIGSIGEHIAKVVDNFSGDRDTLAYHLNLVLTEATANAITHSNSHLKDTVKISILLQDKELNIKVYDHGPGFDFDNLPLPSLDEPKENGMGLFFIRTLMDTVTYTKQADGNLLEIIKYL